MANIHGEHSVAQRLSLCLGLVDDDYYHPHSHEHRGATTTHYHPPPPQAVLQGDIDGANRVVVQVLRVYEKLLSEPSSQRLALVAELLACIQQPALSTTSIHLVLEDQRLKLIQASLWDFLSETEARAEATNAGELLEREGELRVSNVLAFRHCGDYEPLLAREIECLYSAAPQLKGKLFRCAFIGSGPLPISALLMHIKTGCTVQCIDIDLHATKLAKAIVAKLGLSSAIVPFCSLGEKLEERIADCELVFVASLVRAKSDVMRSIRSGVRAFASLPIANDCLLFQTIVAVRSADGLFSILYEPIDRSEIAALGFKELARSRSQKETVNSTFYYVKL